MSQASPLVHLSCTLIFFFHSIHPFRNTLSVKPDVSISLQRHRGGSRRITEGGRPAPLPHQTPPDTGSLAALPPTDQNSSTVTAWSSQIHPPNIQDSCFPHCFYVHTLLCPHSGTTHSVTCLGWTILLWCEENLRKHKPHTNYLTYREVITINFAQQKNWSISLATARQDSGWSWSSKSQH